jgi:predicted membrane metal-binding protein
VSPGNDALALGWGLVTGDDSAFSAQLKTLLRQTGTTHLAAASGANLEYLLSKFGWLKNRLPRRGWVVVSIGLVLSYVAWVGWSGSLWRATIMWLYRVLAWLMGRPITFRNQVVLTLWFTFWLGRSFLSTDGFWLSLLAIVGVHISHQLIAGENYRRIFPQPWLARWLMILAESSVITLVVSGWVWWRFGTVVTIGAFLTPILNVGIGWYQNLTVLWYSLDVLGGAAGLQSAVTVVIECLFTVVGFILRCGLWLTTNGGLNSGRWVMLTWMGICLQRGWLNYGQQRWQRRTRQWDAQIYRRCNDK